jgi:hypothetical protein
MMQHGTFKHPTQGIYLGAIGNDGEHRRIVLENLRSIPQPHRVGHIVSSGGDNHIAGTGGHSRVDIAYKTDILDLIAFYNANARAASACQLGRDDSSRAIRGCVIGYHDFIFGVILLHP